MHGYLQTSAERPTRIAATTGQPAGDQRTLPGVDKKTVILNRRERLAGQPVVDTLQLSDALRRTGMDRDQADGVARALGDELGEHVTARGDLEAFRSAVDSQFELFRSDVDSNFASVRAEIRALDTKFTTKFNVLTVGVALTLAFLAVLTGLNLFPRTPAEVAPAPPPVAPSPVTVYFAPDGRSSVPAAAPATAPAASD